MFSSKQKQDKEKNLDESKQPSTGIPGEFGISHDVFKAMMEQFLDPSDLANLIQVNKRTAEIAKDVSITISTPKKEEDEEEIKEDKENKQQVSKVAYGTLLPQLNEVARKNRTLKQIETNSIYQFFQRHPVATQVGPKIILSAGLGLGLSYGLASLSKLLGASEEEAIDVKFYSTLPLTLAGFLLGGWITYKHYQKTQQAAALNNEIESNPVTPLLKK